MGLALSAAAYGRGTEASASRIYAGQHFRYDEDAGQALGDEVGDFVADHLFRPERHQVFIHHRRHGR
jgi:hypothetical protein